MQDKRVIIRPAVKDDVRFLNDLRNEVRKSLHNSAVFSLNDAERWFENLPESSKRLIISSNETRGIKIGAIRIDKIDLKNSTCYAGLDISPKYQSKGFGRRSWELLLDELFNQMAMEVVYLEVLATNDIAIGLYEKLGFEKCGSFPKAIRRDGKRIDSIVMWITREMVK